MNDILPDMEITFIKTEIEPVVRKMDFGKICVCSKCGKGRIPHVQEIKDGTYKACCEGATLISLRKYTEEVLGVPFENEKWKFDVSDRLALSPEVEKMMNTELVTIGDII